jgi:hypothetical protein
MIPGSSSTLSCFEKRLAEGFFARHETFCPRYGCLRKGFEGVSEDPAVLDSPDGEHREYLSKVREILDKG